METDANELTLKFQRDINRCDDNDRSTRKRGLQKLCDELPWNNSSNRNQLLELIETKMFTILMVTIGDQLEKCRELTLVMLQKILGISDSIGHIHMQNLFVALSARINDQPFPESSEELRLKVVDLIGLALFKPKRAELSIETISLLLQALSKSLLDSFPQVKRSSADVICQLVELNGQVIGMNAKHLLKGLCANAVHQHSKTRCGTLKALGMVITCITDDYSRLMKEQLLPLLSKLVSDTSASTRMELATLSCTVLTERLKRLKQMNSELIAEDIQVLSLIVLLLGDDVAEVSAHTLQRLSNLAVGWRAGDGRAEHMRNDDIEDGELSLREGTRLLVEVEGEETDDKDKMDLVQAEMPRSSTAKDLMTHHLRAVVEVLTAGVESWTSDSRRKSLNGLNALVLLVQEQVASEVLRLVTCLGSPVREQDPDIRLPAERCCESLGQWLVAEEVLDLLIPGVLGELSGTNTCIHRTSALRVLTHLVKGMSRSSLSDGGVVCAIRVAGCIAQESLYDFREVCLREAAVLLVRAVLDVFPSQCTQPTVQRDLCVALVFLRGCLSGEDDLVATAANRELVKLNALCESEGSKISAVSTDMLLSRHFEYILNSAVAPVSAGLPHWTSKDHRKAAFEVLVRDCPARAWQLHERVLSVICEQVQPKEGVVAGSAEANALTYAAQRGEDAMPVAGEVDVRLSLLALLEGMLRAGALCWESGVHINAAAPVIISRAIVPNLVWKVGRVEATVRKVSLAACYAILRIGAIKPEVICSCAGQLVPLMVGNLDDMDTSPRHLCCLSLTVLFARLKGAFGEDAIREIYPKLLKRLDDSSDEVRLAVLGTLDVFLQCGDKSCYSGTMIDYTLDQLFIHLDDPQIDIQVIVTAGTQLDKALVVKKAVANKLTHRTSEMCNNIIVDLQGAVVLDD